MGTVDRAGRGLFFSLSDSSESLIYPASCQGALESDSFVGIPVFQWLGLLCSRKRCWSVNSDLYRHFRVNCQIGLMFTPCVLSVSLHSLSCKCFPFFLTVSLLVTKSWFSPVRADVSIQVFWFRLWLLPSLSYFLKKMGPKKRMNQWSHPRRKQN